jgi:hypothetical protein
MFFISLLVCHIIPKSLHLTTGNENFAECPELCRVQNIGHSAKILFAECSTRQRKTHGKFMLCRVSGTRQNKTLSKEVCFQRQNILLSLIIPGHPGNNMGVFMEPLIDELVRAWEEGVVDIRPGYKEKLQNACLVPILPS